MKRRNEVKPIAEGETIAFSEYLRRAAPRRTRPVIWRSRDLAERLAGSAVGERGTLALIDADGADDMAVAPGLSCVIQVVPAAGQTRVHAHSFWHLCLVRSGSGVVSIGDDGCEDALAEGDTLFIPAWCPHAFLNRGAAPLIMTVLQNLPYLADAGTVARQDADEPVRIVYSEALDG